MITRSRWTDAWMPSLDTFAINVPPNFKRDVLAGRSPAIQLNVDATRMSQATGSGPIQSIITTETSAFLQGHRADTVATVALEPPGALQPRIEPVLVRFGDANYQ